MPDTTQSWMWWMFSTVILAILLNLTSSYMKPYIDKGLGRFSKRRELKSKKKQEEYEKKLSDLLRNRNRFISLQTKIVVVNLGTIFLSLISIIAISTDFNTMNDPIMTWIESVLGEFDRNVLAVVVPFLCLIIALDMINRLREFVNLSSDFLRFTDSEHENNDSIGDTETKPEHLDNNPSCYLVK